MLMIVACIPSRGLMHSQTMDDVLANLKSYEHEVIFAHGRPVPEAYNEVVAEALELKPDYIWMVDDDMLLPLGLLDELVALSAEVAIADYPIYTDGHVVQFMKGKFAFSGLGCTLVKPEVFEKLGKPYFRTDYRYEYPDLKRVEVNNPELAHGLHDIDFFVRLRELGIDVKIAETCAGQYNIKDLPKRLGNNTQFNIEEWKLDEPNSLKHPQPYP